MLESYVAWQPEIKGMEDSQEAQGGTKGVCREIGRKKVVRKEYREGSLEIKCVRWMQKKGETHLSRRHG